MGDIKFPENFYWGAATSAHQVEGNQNNDWADWERKNAKRLVKEAGMYWQKWQQEKFPEMFEEENYISGVACKHYELFREDFETAKNLGHNAHRFSIEWSRIEPKEGCFDEGAIRHYQKVVNALLELGMEPFVTLYHWTLPLWFCRKGGWLNKRSPIYFERYVRKVSSALKGIRFFITINEPNIYASQSYLKGSWPPQKKNFFLYKRVLNNLVKAHCQAYSVIKKINSQIQVGIAKNIVYFEAVNDNLVNSFLKKLSDYFFNLWFLNKIKNYQDFIGLNYYSHNRIDFGFNKNKNKLVSDLGWEIYPKGIYFALKLASKFKKPIFITENGVADKEDKIRSWFIENHLLWVGRAIGEGINVKGYFYWSLLDNFEWDKGFWPRFGLVEVDYKTQKRKIRPSALVYKKIIEQNSL